MIIVLLYILLLTPTAFAVCPVCTFVVSAGAGLAQYFGIDDTITGLWIGGSIVSMITWSIAWCDKRNIKFYGRKILIILIYYFVSLYPLYYYHMLGHELNKCFGVDKIILGVVVGSVFFCIDNAIYEIIKNRNNNKALFPFQKVIMPVLLLIILSAIFYFITI